MNYKYVLTFLFVFAAFSAQAEDAPKESTSTAAEAVTETVPASEKEITYVICKNASVVRTVRVHKKNNGGCETTYTKDGVDQNVGSSWTVDRCVKVLGNIRTNLEKANWKCKDISEARVSSSE